MCIGCHYIFNVNKSVGPGGIHPIDFYGNCLMNFVYLLLDCIICHLRRENYQPNGKRVEFQRHLRREVEKRQAIIDLSV